MKNNIAVLVLISALLGGCENGELVMTPEARAAEKSTVQKRGVARAEMFKECMGLAAKMPRQSDDDVSDVVSECSSQAYYMTNYLE